MMWTRVLRHVFDRTDQQGALELSSRWKPLHLDDYFLDLRCKLNELPPDEESRLARIKAGTPVEICQWALAFYQDGRTTGQGDRFEWFLRCADWLVETQQHDSHFTGGWLYRVPDPYRGRAPWISAMAQGEALSVLLRACTLASSPAKYEEAACLAALPFQRSTEDGGVVWRDAAGRVSLEEYPSSPSSHVLNGWVFAWMGLKEYAEVTGDRIACDLAEESLEGLVAMLPGYDTGYWSSYDLFPFGLRFLASRFYHRLHIAQMKALYSATNRHLFLSLAGQWSHYLASGVSRCRYAFHRLMFKVYCCLWNW